MSSHEQQRTFWDSQIPGDVSTRSMAQARRLRYLALGLNDMERREVAEFYLKLVGLERFMHANIHQHSGGMKQGWAFAWRSLMAAEIYVAVKTA